MLERHDGLCLDEEAERRQLAEVLPNMVQQLLATGEQDEKPPEDWP